MTTKCNAAVYVYLCIAVWILFPLGKYLRVQLLNRVVTLWNMFSHLMNCQFSRASGILHSHQRFVHLPKHLSSRFLSVYTNYFNMYEIES